MRFGLGLLLATVAFPALADPLPSWNDTATKEAIISFVERVTDPASGDYVDPADRIAVFDNDGNLWAEQPMYFQFIFALDTFKTMAAADPSLAKTDVLRAAAAGDLGGVMAAGEAGLLEVVQASHSGMSIEAFQDSVRAWLDTAVNPKTGLRYRDMTYQPMVELLRYLRDEDFQTYIVSGGGIQFVRAFSEDAYGIPPQNVVGSYLDYDYAVVDGAPTVSQGADIAFIDDKAGKPEGIMRHIGLRPIFASGNSDGDFDMLQWSTAGEGPRLGVLLHHTDGVREFAYDRDSHIGRLNRGLDEGPGLGWVIIDMANDWNRIYAGAQ
ncbi:MAG: HAD family hydrolase [Rhodobacterales bacterium]|nr:HAD family hydrolase [Rhodobacterales bacterium]